MSMERLTLHRTWEKAREDLRNELGYKYIWVRLNQIEDILGDTYDLDRLRELVEADKNGRCVVLPCKEGDLVYWSLNGNLYETSFRLSALKYFGKYVFDTREAAEAALEKEASHE